MTDVAALIRFNEGDKRFVYDDATGKLIVPGSVVKGHPTIGNGFALDVAGLDDIEIAFILGRRIALAAGRAAADLGPGAWIGLDVVRQAALVDMAYEMGGGGLAGFPTMLAAVRARDWQKAHDAALDSDWARKEAPVRAGRDATILLTGLWPAEIG